MKRSLILFFLGLYGLTAGGHLYVGDAVTALEGARSLLAGDGMAIAYDASHGGAFGPDGRFYGKYGLGAVLSYVPAAWIGDTLLAPLASSEETRPLLARFPAAVMNVFFGLGLLWMMHSAALLLGASPGAAVRVVLLTGIGTLIWPYTCGDASEMQVAFWLMLAFWACLDVSRPEERGRRHRAALAGSACALAFVTKPYAILTVPFFGGYLWLLARGAGPERQGLASGRDQILAFGAPLVLGAAAVAWYNYHRFGSPLATGYSAAVQAATIPLLTGLHGLLFSPGKSVFLYAPPLILAAAGTSSFLKLHRTQGALILSLGALHLCFFGMLQNWDGDWAWGPRYLVPWVPLAMLLALPLLEGSRPRGSVAVFLGLGLFVQVLGVAVNPDDYVRFMTSNKDRLGHYLRDYPGKVYVPYHQHHWNPDLSPLRGHYRLLLEGLGLGEGPAAVYRLHSTAEELSDRQGHRLLPFVDLLGLADHAGPPDVWFVTFLALVKGPARWVLVVPLLFAGLLSFSLGGLGLRRGMRRWAREATPQDLCREPPS